MKYSPIDILRLETDLLQSASNKFGIYQIKDDIKETKNFRFATIKELDAHGIIPDKTNYNLVYTAPLPAYDTRTFLNEIFSALQQDCPRCPKDFTSRSLSVSDVIVLQQRGKIAAYYVDGIGFKKISKFANQLKAE